MSDQQNSKIAEFVEIAQASPDEARELLEASNWDLEVSILNISVYTMQSEIMWESFSLKLSRLLTLWFYFL